MFSDNLSLLAQIIQKNPYSSWKQISNDPPRYRDYSQDSNPKEQLSPFGLYDFSLGRTVKGLREIASEIGIEVEAKKEKKKGKAAAKEQKEQKEIRDAKAKMREKGAKIREIVKEANKDRWYKGHWPWIQRYFEDERRITGINAEFYRTVLRVTAQAWKQRDGTLIREIVIPIWQEPARKTLIQLQKIQIDELGRKIGKKISGKAFDLPRGIYWPGDNKRIVGQTLIFEGIEDALSVYAAFLQEDGKSDMAFLVSCGVGFFRHVKLWIDEYSQHVEHEKWRLVLDNDGPVEVDGKGAAAKASLILGNSDNVCRYMPTLEKQDANSVMQQGGAKAVWHWFSEIAKNEVTAESIQEKIDQASRAEELEVIRTPHAYHWRENPLSDAAVVELFLSRFSDVVRVTTSGLWFVWSSKKGVWLGPEYGSETLVRNYISGLIYAYKREFERRRPMLKDNQIAAWKAFIVSLGNAGRHRSVLQVLRGASGLLCSVNDFDADPDLLNVQNGVLRLSTGELLEHDPRYLCSRQANVTWQGLGKATERECPVWSRFLMDVVCGNRELLAYKLRQLGYAISGHTRERAFFFHIGTGRNGKSVEGEALLGLLGSYAQTVSAELFTESHGYSREEMYELALLPGIRLALCGETDERRSWSEAALKRFTGGSDWVRARPIREAPFSFQPVFKLIVHGNNRPRVNVGDSALWGRMHLVPYEFVAENPDASLGDRLAAEKAGVLAQLVAGYQEWLEIGLRPPAQVLEAKDDYRQESFSDVDGFLRHECVIDENAEISARDLYEAYEEYCRSKRKRPRSIQSFGMQLSEKDIKNRKSDGAKIRIGIRLKSEIEKTEFPNQELNLFSDLSDEEDPDLH